MCLWICLKAVHIILLNLGWPSTQPNRISHNLAAHHRAAHNLAVRWCTCSVVCNLPRQQNVGWPDVGPTSALSSRRWASVNPIYRVVWLVVKRITHTGDAHNRASTPLSCTTEPAHHWVECSSVVSCEVVCNPVRLCRESPAFMQYTLILNTMAYKTEFCAS